MKRKILASEAELIEYMKKHVYEHWDRLTKWEQGFIEDVIGYYCQYKSNMLISSNQIDRLLEISEKII